MRDWRDLDRRLVDAQEARRILDRLYGYEVSPVLWKKVMPRLSAGRVQSVATRLLVERERARMRFRAASLLGHRRHLPGGKRETRSAPPWSRSTAAGWPRARTSARTAPSRPASTWCVFDEGGARGLADRLADAPFAVRSVEEKPYRRSPYAPFMTSTLQQEAGRKLRFGSQRTMQVAQRLYENGFITYMRTDSTTLSDQALEAARTQARALYGPDVRAGPGPAATTRRSRTPRRPTRPSARRARRSARPSRPGCTATRPGCTT